jgi:TPR repeat protein
MALEILETAFAIVKFVYEKVQLMKENSQECVELEARCSKVVQNLNSLTDDPGLSLQSSLLRSISDIHEVFVEMDVFIDQLMHSHGWKATLKNFAFASEKQQKLAAFNTKLDRLTVELIAAMGAQGLRSIANVDRNLQSMHTDLLLSGKGTQLAVEVVSAKQDQLLDSQKYITQMLLSGSKSGSVGSASFQVSASDAFSQGEELRLKLRWTDAYQFYKCAALQDHPSAAAWCAYAYLEGLISPPMKQEAHDFALLSHRASDAFGTACYASCLAKGWGTSQNLPDSINLVMRALNLGNTYAALLLGDMYYHGEIHALPTIHSILSLKP